MFDTNGDGQISVEELGEAMKQAGQDVCEEDLKEMIKAVDRNGKKSHLWIFFNVYWLSKQKTPTLIMIS